MDTKNIRGFIQGNKDHYVANLYNEKGDVTGIAYFFTKFDKPCAWYIKSGERFLAGTDRRYFDADFWFNGDLPLRELEAVTNKQYPGIEREELESLSGQKTQ